MFDEDRLGAIGVSITGERRKSQKRPQGRKATSSFQERAYMKSKDGILVDCILVVFSALFGCSFGLLSGLFLSRWIDSFLLYIAVALLISGPILYFMISNVRDVVYEFFEIEKPETKKDDK